MFFLISKNSILKKKKNLVLSPLFLSYTQCSVCCMLNDLINWEPLRKTMVLSLPRSNISVKMPDLPDSDFEGHIFCTEIKIKLNSHMTFLIYIRSSTCQKTTIPSKIYKLSKTKPFLRKMCFLTCRGP